MIIGDLVPNVTSKLANRTDLAAKAPRWIKDSIKELTESYPFEELRVKGPTNLTFTIGQFEYPTNAFLNNNDEYTEIVSWFIVLNGTTGPGYILKYRTPPVVEPYTQISGIPRYWTRVGSQLIVGFNPDKTYTTWMRYQKKHQFSGDLNADVIRMPDTWQDIIEYAAAERGAIEERMLDYASQYHSVLFGDPEFEQSNGAKGKPGLIFRRVSQRERDMSNNERALIPYVGRYNPR